jgi:3-oxoadipate enol-lactonase/4-carboxymuconolactone decarboxylase
MSVPVIVGTASAPPTTAGEAVALVLGPSLGSTTAIWDRAVPYLAPTHPVLRWDLPGHGASPAATIPFSTAEIARGVLRAADAAGLDRFAAVGISLGGVVSLELALAAPDRVSSVTMICSLPKIATAETWMQRAADVRAMGTPSLVTASAARWFTPAFLEAEPEVASRVLNGLLDLDDESYALCADALRTVDLRDRIADLGVPFTIIAGELDPIIPLADARAAVANAVNGHLDVVEGASHLAAVEKPDVVAGLVLESIDPGRTP